MNGSRFVAYIYLNCQAKVSLIHLCLIESCVNEWNTFLHVFLETYWLSFVKWMDLEDSDSGSLWNEG